MRLFNVTSRTLLRGSYLLAEMQSVYSTAPTDLAVIFYKNGVSIKRKTIKVDKPLNLKTEQKKDLWKLISKTDSVNF